MGDLFSYFSPVNSDDMHYKMPKVLIGGRIFEVDILYNMAMCTSSSLHIAMLYNIQ